MSYNNGDLVKIMSNGKAYKGAHDGKIGEVMFSGDKRSNFNITVLIEKERNPNSKYGVWYIDAKYLLKVKDVSREDISDMTQSEAKAYNDYLAEEIRLRFMQRHLNEIANWDWEREYNCKFKINKKENENMKTIGILDLWKKNKDDKDKEMYQREFDRVLLNDVHFKFLKDKTDEINTYLIENGFTKSNEVPRLIYTSEETKAEIENLKKIREGNLADITVLYQEIKTMLSACDTYEQEMDVLKAYRIVDENGVLVKE